MQRWLIGTAVVLCLGLLAASAVDFMSLHDIYRDYASPEVLAAHGVDGSPLPWWTATSMEWDWVTWSLVGRVALLLANIGLLVASLRLARAVPGPEVAEQR